MLYYNSIFTYQHSSRCLNFQCVLDAIDRPYRKCLQLTPNLTSPALPDTIPAASPPLSPPLHVREPQLVHDTVVQQLQAQALLSVDKLSFRGGGGSAQDPTASAIVSTFVPAAVWQSVAAMFTTAAIRDGMSRAVSHALMQLELLRAEAAHREAVENLAAYFVATARVVPTPDTASPSSTGLSIPVVAGAGAGGLVLAMVLVALLMRSRRHHGIADTPPVARPARQRPSAIGRSVISFENPMSVLRA